MPTHQNDLPAQEKALPERAIGRIPQKFVPLDTSPYPTTMPRLKKITACLLWMLPIGSTAWSQFKLEQPVLIGQEQGLPTNDVRMVRKGKDGFIWLGTGDGLCRFDGQQVKVYAVSGDKHAKDFDNMVTAVLPVGDEIWMGTNQGVAVLNTLNESIRYYQIDQNGKTDSVIRRFNQSVSTIVQDRQGNIWVGTRERGAWMYDPKTDNFKNFPFDPSVYSPIVPSLGSNTGVLSIEPSRTNDSIIWVGTAAGLQMINKFNGKVRWFTYSIPNKEYQVSLNAFRRVYHHDDGLLYVGSWEAGVNVYNPADHSFTPLVIRNKTVAADLLLSPISTIQRKNREEIWISSIRGVLVYNTKEQTVTWFKANDPLRHDFYGVDYIDESNRIWFCNVEGLRYFDPVVQQFTHHSFEHLSGRDWAYVFYLKPEQSSGKITVCPRSTNGLYIFDKETSSWQKRTFTGVKFPPTGKLLVRGFAKINANEYLVPSDEGLFRCDANTGRMTPIKNPKEVVFNRWGEVLQDDEGDCWISAGSEGLVRWNLKTGKQKVYQKELVTGSSDCNIGRVNRFLQDSHRNIWFIRPGGFSVHLRETDSFLHFIYDQNPDKSFPAVIDFAEDKEGRIWVIGPDGWYGYIDSRYPEKGVVHKADLAQQGVSSAFINFATDKDGNVWGYNNKELLRINPADLSLSKYSFSYGANTLGFFHFSFLPDGNMILGGRNGIVIANPAELKRNTELPEPYISQLKVMNNPVGNFTVDSSKVLNLAHRENFLSIFFSAKAYTMPGLIRFRYRLKEFDDWVETNTGHLANYTNVPPGNYVFQLQAANNEGVWNEKMIQLPIFIATPWWLTWWFRVGFCLALAGLIYWLYRLRINQIKKKEKLKSRYEKKLANVEMTALLAQMNPHFLFNSLNSIDSYIIKNESGKASEYLNNFARLMRLILQNSRSNYISLKDELEALDLYLQMESLRFNGKFKYEIKIGSEVDVNSTVIPPMLIQPYVENAIWHGLMHKQESHPGKVEITISQRDNNLICQIRDNGIGRVRAEEIKAQKGTHKRSMGMQITRDRIEMINKLYNSTTRVDIIDLADGEGKAVGTEVELVIPV